MPTRPAPEGYMPPLPEGCALRVLRPGEEPALLELLLAAFDGQWPRRALRASPLEHLRWKLASHPFALTHQLVAEVGGRIVACRPMWVSSMMLDGKAAMTRLPIDRAVHPDHQRTGLMTALEARTPPEWVSHFDAIIGITNNWQSITFVPGTRYHRRVDVVARILDEAIAAPEPSAYSLQQVDTFDERADALWQTASRAFRGLFLRSSERLNYRFADARAGNYTILVAQREGVLLGYAVFTTWQGTGQIADLFVLPDRFDVLEALVLRTLGVLQHQGASSVECWSATHHPYSSTLNKLGFNELRRSQRLSIAPQKPGISAAFFADPLAPVHLMAGDTDLA